MINVKILSGGAAQGLVKGLAARFKEQTGYDIVGEFGAVGLMAEKLRNGTPTDLVILTSALIEQLGAEGYIQPASIADIGAVETAVAVRAGEPTVTIDTGDELRDAFLTADAIYVPDMQTSTAGLHVAKVLRDLGIAETVATRLNIHPNGATAMRQLAASTDRHPIGCTQTTEIIATEGIMLSGALPRGYDLATIYTAAVAANAASPKMADTLIRMLTSVETAELRRSAGFLGEGMSEGS
jgi:molybdate transport system substrate-binding protein